ncbi:lipoate--protein ligase family protein [Nakamurella deserti]|uniref:lipoate--protein ligase family protein n=1 Tax=Nakamurella deserti TaxID=2164074 RepID=UPI000DBE7006|nr:lipoate--protein ligase family protein [Nakamurella deserti]
MTVTAEVGSTASLPAQLAVLIGDARVLRVVRDADLPSAAADLAVGPALLRRVADRPGEAWLRLYRPLPTVGFSRRDTREPGFAAAATAATGLGFEPAVRAPGGRAAAYHRSTVCFDLVLPDHGTDPVGRLAALGEVLTAVLVGLGVDARLGPVPDEYCPGRFSVNGGGRGKIAGTAGRRVRGALLLGGSIVVADAAPLREVIEVVYRELGVAVDTATVAAATDFGFTGPVSTLVDELVATLSHSVATQPAALPADVLAVSRAVPPLVP